ncbi:MAG: class I SAM-dependent methyltransferase [Ferruginibacter sp.]
MSRGATFKNQSRSFSALLKQIDPDTVSSETYCRKYFSYLLSHRDYFLEIYADVFEKILLHTSKQKEELSLLDYGAGNGLLGIFAKYCGFKKVFINDSDPAFLEAAKQLSAILNIGVDGYISGDETSLMRQFQNEKPDVVAGTDVIEHIYNLESFFKILKKLNPEIITVFTTASNPENKLKVRQLKKLQRTDELIGGSPSDSELFGAVAHGSYLEMRKVIIRNHFLINENEMERLARSTRGLAFADILSAAEKFIKTGVMPQPDNHPTNTCHPITGSWTERILTINQYTYIYNTAGFKLNLYEGFYDEHKQLGKKVLNKILNKSVKFLGKPLAPYIILAGS